MVSGFWEDMGIFSDLNTQMYKIEELNCGQTKKSSLVQWIIK